jgi:glycosyltransferase involved in cell wall biosynthesis
VHEELAGAGVARSRLRLIPSAVDAARFRPDPLARAKVVDRYDLPGDALIAGAAAQLIRRKGLDALPRLASRWSEAEPRFRLLVFGQGGRGPALERRVAALGLTDTIRLCGYERDWPELVPGLDLFLHPARREGLGLAVLEAMSAGVPVVAAAVGGIVDAIEDGVDGRLLPPAAFERWYACVLDLLRDADTRARLGRAARRKVESAFTIARMTESYIALYREIAGHGGR